ncbi:TPA-induced transmembrane protein [Entelurus aequoreus]|uniref:TPA-induced transmembrane protein n=1 Tax=Entelurus aequoreus TaxID=161455 RepID=UPI002B1E4A6E|nr:TPA-induced transmembrane protein [Entelurus aequoreus]XP_061917043.1 TPA-induced transmembrane protein [Entelurus aequoreus]
MDMEMQTVKSNMDMEMQTVKSNMAAHQMATATGNGEGHTHRGPQSAETGSLLQAQCNGGSVEMKSAGRVLALRGPQGMKMQKELREVVCWKIPLWVLLLFLLVIMVAIVFIALALCPVLHQDVDEKFDPSTFNIPRLFKGNFSLLDLPFSDDLLVPSSNQSRALSRDLQGKLTVVYSSSPALSRYFSKAEVHAFRNGSVVAEYWLTFLMPEQQEEQLRRFTLSREMVYNVLRQSLHQQEDHIDPLSLTLV